MKGEKIFQFFYASSSAGKLQFDLDIYKYCQGAICMDLGY